MVHINHWRSSSSVGGDSKDSHRLYLARKTVLKMLKNRGYLIPDSDIELSFQEFRGIFWTYGRSYYQSRFRSSFLHKKNPYDKVQVVFSEADVMGSDGVRTVLKQITGNLSRLILVMQNKITNPARKILETHSFKTEILQVSDLLVSDVLVNITKHQELSDDKPHLKKHSITEKQNSSAGAASAKAEEEEEEEEEEGEENEEEGEEEEEEEEGEEDEEEGEEEVEDEEEEEEGEGEEEEEEEEEAEAASGSQPQPRKKQRVETSISDPSQKDNTKADIAEYNNLFNYVIDMPGMKDKNEIHVQLINKKLLKVTGVREKNPFVGAIKNLSTERAYRLQKTFTLPEGADPERIGAVYKDGLLTVTVSKLPPEPASKRNIQVEFR